MHTKHGGLCRAAVEHIKTERTRRGALHVTGISGQCSATKTWRNVCKEKSVCESVKIIGDVCVTHIKNRLLQRCNGGFRASGM